MLVFPFEYEERYKVVDPKATRQLLTAAGFALMGTESQVDHWFIPKDIMSPDEQYNWFDYKKGSAVRIREQTTQDGTRDIITVKQLVTPGDHSTMTNHEEILTVAGVRKVLSLVGEEFNSLLSDLHQRDGDEVLAFLEVKRLIEQSGRKEYITLNKERATFRNPSVQDVVIDLDVIPALKETALGFSAAIEIEYTGDASTEEARKTVRNVGRDLDYDQKDILTKALPGQAIAYLAKF
jgi:adenylate cyclase class IV